MQMLNRIGRGLWAGALGIARRRRLGFSPLEACVLAVCLASALALGAAVEASDAPEGVSVELRERAIATLRGVMAAQERWVKVHAAEFLLALGYPEGVREAFETELAAHSEEPEYRIGIWRVLARASYRPEQREEWIVKIRDAFLDAEGPDRIHAAETLGKLSYAPPPDERERFEQAAASDDARLAALAVWPLVNAGAIDEPDLEAMLGPADQEKLRLTGYMLRFQARLSAGLVEKLAEAARREPEDSSARVYLTSAAFRHAIGAESANDLRHTLLAYLKEGDKPQKYEAAMALSIRGDTGDLPALVAALEDPEADVRSAAAHAILQLERRAPSGMTALDWIVIAVYGFSMIGVGWYYMRRTRSSDDYLLGGRNMRPWAVGLSLFATLLSTLTYLALPGEMIQHGPMIMTQLLAYPFIYVVVGWFVIPFIMRLRVTSAYEILEARLGVSVRLLGSFFFLALRLLWMATIIYATTDKVLVPLLGLDSSRTPWICAVLGAVTVVYTSMGGIRAVVTTDVAQTAILLGGAVLALVVITVSLGGVGEWWPTVWAANWEQPKWGFDADARISAGWLVTSTFLWHVSTSASDQMAVQRYLATRDAGSARRVLLVSLVAGIVVMAFLALLGLALFAFFRANPHTLGYGQTIQANADRLLPRFVVFSLPAGLSGLVVAGLLAAAMSSLSSGLNSSCSVITVDFIDRLRRGKLTDASHVRLAKFVSVLVGVVVVAISFGIPLVKGNLLEICYKVVNLFTVPLFILFAMAMFVPWATPFGTWAGALASAASAILVAFWKPLTGFFGLWTDVQGLSFTWMMPVALVVGVVVGMAASLLPIGPAARARISDIQVAHENDAAAWE